VTTSDEHSTTYRQRFSQVEENSKREIWEEIGRYLQRYIPSDARVLDIGCDLGYFIGNIRAAEKVGSDLRDVRAGLPADVRFVQSDSLTLESKLPEQHFDVVLMSNFLEHLPSGDAVIEQLRVTYRLLAPGGRVIVLQPNIRLIGGKDWDFVDHKTALREERVLEAAGIAGIRQHTLVPRFLPYTVKSRLPRSRMLVRLYLACRPAWLVLGKQTLYIGEKPGD
jgi:SAM-dependent methyltransferase